MKQILFNNLKNLPGWSSSRKLLAFAVDDYAAVRVASSHAQQRLANSGLNLSGHMDRYDAMETRADLEALFEVLDSVRDVHGRPAIFTAYALSANPDFDAILRSPTGGYVLEPVTQTFVRLEAEQPAAYRGAWSLWKEGISRRLIRPQFHGREHLNVRLFETKLFNGSKDLRANLQNRSLAGLTGDESMPGVGFYQAFAVHDDQCLELHRGIIEEGMKLFEACYGYKSVTFTPPGQVISPLLYPVCERRGIRLIHKPRFSERKVRSGEHCREVCWTGKQRKMNHLSMVRNVVFEPGQKGDSIDIKRVKDQVAAAFKWSKPAIISSHRVNFCGHIDECYRSKSLAVLANLLNLIVNEWPDVEFVSVDEIADFMKNDYKN